MMDAIVTTFVPGTPRLAYDETGTGVPVVFLHGIGGNRTNWSEQLPAVGRHFHAVAWDARGYGASDDYDGDLSFDLFNSDLLRLLDHLAARRAVLVGLSMGGRIAQHFYRHHTDRVRALVLCDTLAELDASFTAAKRAEFLAARKAPLLAGKTPADIAPAVAASLASRNCPQDKLDRLIASMSALRKDSYLKALDAVARHDTVAALPEITVPTLLAFGDQDRLTTPETGRGMAARIQGSAFVLIENCGHLSNIEQPEVFNGHLLSFLAKHARNSER
jgi:3-oxoadipate enol-lactonase